MTCQNDPRLSHYFTLLYKIRVPRAQLEGKMRMAGLDPALLDTPDAPSPLGPIGSEENGGDGDGGGDGDDGDSGSNFSDSDWVINIMIW